MTQHVSQSDDSRHLPDDPARAIRAALGFQSEMKELATKIEEEGLPGLSFRVGINTGRVMVGTLADQKGGETSIVGDVVNVASRLEQACLPGEILISHETYRHVRGLFRVDAQPPISVKGKTDAHLGALATVFMNNAG